MVSFILNQSQSKANEHSNPVIWGGDYNALKERINNGTADTSKIRLFIGYMECGDLEAEIEGGKWACLDASEKIILSGKNPWRYLVKKLGPFGQLLLNTPSHGYQQIPAEQLN